MCLCVCVCVSVCVCVCVCVCLCFFTLKASYVCKMSGTYLRCTDQRCYVVSIIPGASAKFLDLRFWKCHISPPITKLQHADKLDKKKWVLYQLLAVKVWEFFLVYLLLLKIASSTTWVGSKLLFQKIMLFRTKIFLC